MFAADVRTRDLRPVGPLVVELVQTALDQEQLPADALDPDDLRLARAASRRVVGFMNDMAQTSRWIIERD